MTTSMPTRNILTGLLPLVALTILTFSGCATPPQFRTGPNTAGESAITTNQPTPYVSRWHLYEDRTWVGSDLWASDLTGWHIAGGALRAGANQTSLQHVTLLTHRAPAQLGRLTSRLLLSVPTTQSADKAAGIVLGLPSPTALTGKDTKADQPGLFAGIASSGQLLLQTSASRRRLFDAIEAQEATDITWPASTELVLTVAPVGKHYTVLLQALDPETGVELARLTLWGMPASLVRGHPGLAYITSDDGDASGIHFERLSIQGMVPVPQRDGPPPAGPIVAAWHTIHHDTLRLTTQLMPVGKRLNVVKLQTLDVASWKTIAQSEIRPTDFTATFAIANWSSQRQPYRLEYRESLSDATISSHYYSGIVQARVTNKPILTIADAEDETGDTEDVPDVLVFYDTPVPPHTEQSLRNLQEWYRWCAAHREVGLSTPCLGIYHQAMTYRQVRIELATDEHTGAGLVEQDWEGWKGADMKVVCSPDMYLATAKRDISDEPKTNDVQAALTTADDGIGRIHVNVADRRVSYTRIADGQKTDMRTGDPLPGWPIVCDHSPSYDRNHVGYLPPIEIEGSSRAVIQVLDENTGGLVYSVRTRRNAFLPRVFAGGRYKVTVGLPETGTQRSFPGLVPLAPGEATPIRVAF